MSKRRLNKRQVERIKKVQSNYQQEKEGHSLRQEGLVLTRFGHYVEVEVESGLTKHCSIRPHIDSLVAGDRVVWQPEGDRQGVILSRYPRQSVLGRPDRRGQIKAIAANISQIMVVVAPKPELSWALLDSYLVMAEYLDLPISIILNKVDIPCQNLQEILATYYEPLGYPLISITQENPKSYELLNRVLNHQTSVFVGQSGVGKSSIISQILPHESKIRIASVSVHSELGRHTTSNSCLYHLLHGGALIDSPGVREFGLWHQSSLDIAKGYREFKPLISNCKFRNCTHIKTPGCAIINAVEQGLIAQLRYKNFVDLQEEK